MKGDAAGSVRGEMCEDELDGVLLLFEVGKEGGGFDEGVGGG